MIGSWERSSPLGLPGSDGRLSARRVGWRYSQHLSHFEPETFILHNFIFYSISLSSSVFSSLLSFLCASGMIFQLAAEMKRSGIVCRSLPCKGKLVVIINVGRITFYTLTSKELSDAYRVIELYLLKQCSIFHGFWFLLPYPLHVLY